MTAIRVRTRHPAAYAAFAPRRDGDVGYDLYCHIDPERQTRIDRLVSRLVGEPVHVLWPLRVRSIASTIQVGMGRGLWLFIDARSSARRLGLDVAGGRVIDSGYRGPLFSILRNWGWRPRLVREGERYAQAVFIPAARPAREWVEEFGPRDASERGEHGFGSTGR